MLFDVLLLHCCISFIPFLLAIAALDTFSLLPSGNATLTHYDLPFNYVASCGCVGLSTRHPTAALNSRAYGSQNSYGPQCGVCYRLSLLSTPLTPPPPNGTGVAFRPDDLTAPSVVVKITDACPLGGDWCTQTDASPRNPLGAEVHFDLAWPSPAINDAFFPTDNGRDYGAWRAQYERVDCEEWAGYQDQEAWGSDWSQQGSACCPLRPSLIDAPTTPANMSSSPPSSSVGDSFDAEANTQHCPSYTNQISLGLTPAAMASQVPNTSNILSRRQGGESNGASRSTSSYLLPWTWIFLSPQLAQAATAAEDWLAVGPPPLLS